ncbi:hypothetical protein LEP1GSC089_4812 [Leptospira interrogans serovar Autumnalis str. LP101]|uniref:Uncharacterized protein n=1 Tax=Leptospira interrogans str. UI 12621 TaxID=1049937 RepID=A0A0F6H517_LEPIR|nr:hypothetical protein LEP1GSC007_3658 [Leptospira interrogans serovar Bulgarica str. Mallika]EKO23305.1 hypothetical protein LEP1GSC104_0125 [Leptospira interrogans str. UI 12621]EMN55615.1 hypothetical protein LEP1GSC089_4812 [Leptospira interrogans serovar Autumnalis str. LP101]
MLQYNGNRSRINFSTTLLIFTKYVYMSSFHKKLFWKYSTL